MQPDPIPDSPAGDGTGFPGGLVVVSNRLPVRRIEHRDGNATWDLSPGGLVSALEPILRSRGGTWIGWPGTADAGKRAFDYRGLALQPVPISARELQGHYDGFCNRTIWPLYHDSIRTPGYRRPWWEAHVAINRRFAEAAQHYREAAELERKIPYMEPPYWYYPVQQSLGAALFRAGKYEEAREAFVTALAHSPNNGWVLYGLAASEKALGRPAQAAAAQAALARAWMGNPGWLRMDRL